MRKRPHRLDTNFSNAYTLINLVVLFGMSFQSKCDSYFPVVLPPQSFPVFIKEVNLDHGNYEEFHFQAATFTMPPIKAHDKNSSST